MIDSSNGYNKYFLLEALGFIEITSFPLYIHYIESFLFYQYYIIILL